MALHDGLGEIDEPPAGEAVEDDVERGLELIGVVVGDVSEGAPLRRFVGECGIFAVEERDHRAGGLVDDPADHVEGVKRIVAPRGCRELEQELADVT